MNNTAPTKISTFVMTPKEAKDHLITFAKKSWWFGNRRCLEDINITSVSELQVTVHCLQGHHEVRKLLQSTTARGVSLTDPQPIFADPFTVKVEGISRFKSSKKKKIELPSSRRQFRCPTCDGTKYVKCTPKVACGYCANGICNYCGGAGHWYETCTAGCSNGIVGQSNYPNGMIYGNCLSCGGRGKILKYCSCSNGRCSTCRGTGQVVCSMCEGTGIRGCPTCAKMGTVEIWQVLEVRVYTYTETIVSPTCGIPDRLLKSKRVREDGFKSTISDVMTQHPEVAQRYAQAVKHSGSSGQLQFLKSEAHTIPVIRIEYNSKGSRSGVFWIYGFTRQVYAPMLKPWWKFW